MRMWCPLLGLAQVGLGQPKGLPDLPELVIGAEHHFRVGFVRLVMYPFHSARVRALASNPTCQARELWEMSVRLVSLSGA